MLLQTCTKDSCIGSFISIPKLEKAVIDELNCLSREYLNKDELEQKVQFNNNLQEQKKSVENEISIYEKKISEYTKGIRELYLDKVKGVLSESGYLVYPKTSQKKKKGLKSW